MLKFAGLVLLPLAISPAAAGSQSSNSSSNSSGGIHTRIDSYHATDDRGGRYYHRRFTREREGMGGRRYMRERYGRSYGRRQRGDDDD